MVEILAIFSARPGKEEALRQATLAIVEPTRREPGCAYFVVHEDSLRPGAFFIRESWLSEADLDAHFQQPYLLKLVEQHKDLLAGPLTLHRLKVYA